MNAIHIALNAEIGDEEKKRHMKSAHDHGKLRTLSKKMTNPDEWKNERKIVITHTPVIIMI